MTMTPPGAFFLFAVASVEADPICGAVFLRNGRTDLDEAN